MHQVTRKDRESFENLMRRFSRKIHQSGKLADAKKRQYHEKPLSKKEQREVAIRKTKVREKKMRQIILGS